MHKITLSIAALVAALPLAAHAQTSADLQAQVVALLQQVQQLQAQLSGQGATGGTAQQGAQGVSGLAQQAGVQVIDSSACPQIGRSLKLGSTGDDVTRLQQFLARDTTIYPEGTVSGYYGPLTEAAVRRWQTKFNIVSSGNPEATGYGVVGPRTAAAISLQCSLYAGGGGSSSGATGTVGGYIQVSPISGNAPLQVNVQATVNTTTSCNGATYLLSWGDGSAPQQIPVPAGNCNQLSQTYSHTYQYGGTYQISLSAGSHRTNATVTVFGTSAPVVPVVPTTPTQALPAESVSASPQSGTAPLAVTFTGIITSANPGWCASGCSAEITFGDGSSATIPIPVAQNTYQNYSVSHTYAVAGSYTATLHKGMQSAGRGASASVGVSVTGNASYGPFSVTPTQGDPLSIGVSFTLPSACTGYALTWGDSSTPIAQADASGSCGASQVTKTFTHQYPSAGSYSIMLKRGPTLSVTDTATVSISN